MKAVLWFQPAYPGNVGFSTFLTSHAVAKHLGALGIQMGVTGISTHDIAWVRNFAVTVFHDLMPEYSHLLFVDSDMSFPPQLITDMVLFDEPVVGGIYRKKSKEPEWAASGIKTPQTRGHFMEVEGLGAGCLLIRRDAIERMVAEIPSIVDERKNSATGFAADAGLKRLLRPFDTMNEDGGVVSEDIAFCRRWRSIGGQVWGAAGHDIQHIGLHGFGGSYLSHLAAEKAQKAAVEATKQAAE